MDLSSERISCYAGDPLIPVIKASKIKPILRVEAVAGFARARNEQGGLEPTPALSLPPTIG